MFSQAKLLLAAVYGGLRPSLAQIAERMREEHQQGNTAARRLKADVLRRGLAWVSHRPEWPILLIAAAYALATLAGQIPTPAWAPQTETAGSDDLKALVLALLGAQATLLGLVYPLVIALVSLLFDARSSSSSKLQVYFHETEAVAIGFWSVAFVAMTASQALFFGALPQNWLAAWAVLNLLWFLCNLVGLGFFVSRSLDFMRPSQRQALMEAYVAQVAWRAELFEQIRTEEWNRAAEKGHLAPPADSPGELLSLLNLDGRHPAATRHFDRPHLLTDVRLGLLDPVLRHQSSGTNLTFAVAPGLSYDKDTVLARTAGPELPRLARWLLRRAFRFTPRSGREPVRTVAEFLKEGASDLALRAEEGRYDEFRARLREVVDLHVLAYELARTSDGGSFAARGRETENLGREWALAYLDLFKQVAARPSEDGRFFEACARLPMRLVYRLERHDPFPAVSALLFLPYALMRALLENAVRRHGEALTVPSSAGTLFEAGGRGRVFYHGAWRDFVGGWEELGSVLMRMDDAQEIDEWADLIQVVPALKRHLHSTSMFCALAAKSGERHAIGWTVDMMLKWRGKVSQGWRVRHGHDLRRELPTLALADQSWSEIEDLPLSRFGAPPEAWEVFGAAVENAWTDSLVVLTCSLLDLMGEAGASGQVEDGPALAAAALFNNRSFDPSASTHPRALPLDIGNVLQAVLRLIGAGNRFDEEGYGVEIGGLAEAIDQLEGPSYISSRIYSLAGEASVEGQTEAQFLLMAARYEITSRRRGSFTLSEETRSLLLAGADDARRRLLDHLKAMRDAGQRVAPDRGCAVIATLRGAPCSPAELADRLTVVDRALADCIVEIDKAREVAIRLAENDFGRLAAVAEAAAQTAFGRNGTFPLPLFGSIGDQGTGLPVSRGRWSISNRGAYTRPRLGTDTIDLEAWARALGSRVGGVLVSDIVSARPPTLIRRPRTAEGYWRALKEAFTIVDASGQTALAVRRARTEPSWLWSWHLNDGVNPRPPDLKLEPHDEAEPSCDLILNGVPIYSSRGIGSATWVFGRELLARVDFGRFGGGGLIEADLEVDTTNPWGGIMSLAFARHITLLEGPLIQIIHPRNPTGGGAS